MSREGDRGTLAKAETAVTQAWVQIPVPLLLT